MSRVLRTPVDWTHSVGGGGDGASARGLSPGLLLVLNYNSGEVSMPPALALTPVLSLVSSLLVLQSSTHFQSINQTCNTAKAKHKSFRIWTAQARSFCTVLGDTVFKK